MKVLIVDDEPEILELVAEVFKSRSHLAFEATCVSEAIESLKRNTFDAIVSDFKMPNENGLGLLNFVNSLKTRPTFFFFSGEADLSRIECLKAGAREFFCKPLDLDVLVTEIEKKMA
ncbi:MAG: response regulator [Bacteriovorax sp.]